MLVYLNECKSLSFVLKYSFVISKFCFMRTIWKVFCFCAQYNSDVPSGRDYVSVHSTHFWCTVWKDYVSVHSTFFWCAVWKGFCFYAQYTFLMYRLESVLFLCTVHFSELPFGKCSVSMHSTYFWLPFGWFSFSVHSTLFWITVWKLFCFYAQYIFLITV